ncbi:PREDICTED: non-specific lipid-transfer protein 2-like [Camelina sativa]|uniref:Non-specific lipid-transfer protein 2-like n=1 Tax=Camelina sativa TaxID=90675 RepID=A0ABM0ZEH8_CAMSA|nr:PREDICTED: non-specific lipid-transfer protein 2-like [Camelina sativa]
MKFTTLVMLVLVIVIQLSPTLIRATTIAEGANPIEEKLQCIVMNVIIPCLLPLTNPLIQPVAHCCQVMVEYKPCLCQFIKGEWSQVLFNSPNARKTYKACHIPFPIC